MGVELISTGGTSAALRADGAVGEGRRRAHWISRDARWPREDTASKGAWRAARRARQRRARSAISRARHRADRSAGGQSLSVRGNGRQGRRLRGVHREHRHRRAGAHSRRGQEPRRGDGHRRSGRLRARASGDAAERRRHDARRAPGARRQGLRAHGSLRRGDQPLVRCDLGRGDAGVASVRRSAASCRCATARIRTSAPPSTAPAMRDLVWPRPCSTRARSCPTTISTIRTRRWSSWPSSARTSQPSPSSSTPIRAAPPSAPRSRTPISRRCAATPVSAFGGIVALNGTIDAAAAEEITKIIHGGGDRAGRHRRGEGDFRRQEESAPADDWRTTGSECGRRRRALARWRLARAVARQRCGHGVPISRLSASASRPSAN